MWDFASAPNCLAVTRRRRGLGLLRTTPHGNLAVASCLPCSTGTTACQSVITTPLGANYLVSPPSPPLLSPSSLPLSSPDTETTAKHSTHRTDHCNLSKLLASVPRIPMAGYDHKVISRFDIPILRLNPVIYVFSARPCHQSMHLPLNSLSPISYVIRVQSELQP